MTTKPRVKLPESMKAGDTVEVKTFLRHPMERGYRKDAQGKTIPRNIIHTFTADLDGTRVFNAKFGTGVAANPFMSFFLRVSQPGRLKLTWTDDTGLTIEAERQLNVVA